MFDNFDFLKKGLGVVSPPHFVYDISRKMFFILYSILIDQISLFYYFYFLRYWAVCALQLFVFQIVSIPECAFNNIRPLFPT